MPSIRDYPEATSLESTDAIPIDRVGTGTMYVEGSVISNGGSGGTPGGSAGQIQVNVGGSAFGGVTVSGDGTITSTGVLTVSTHQGSTFAPNVAVYNGATELTSATTELVFSGGITASLVSPGGSVVEITGGGQSVAISSGGVTLTTAATGLILGTNITGTTTSSGSVVSLSVASAHIAVSGSGSAVTSSASAINFGAGLSASLVSSGGTAVNVVATNLPLSFEFLGGTPASASEVMGLAVMGSGYSIPANFSGSYGTIVTNPTSTFVATVSHNASSCGTMSVGTGGAYTFVTSGGSAVPLSAGDTLKFVAPATTDATAANFAWTIMLVRS